MNKYLCSLDVLSTFYLNTLCILIKSFEQMILIVFICLGFEVVTLSVNFLHC